MIYVTADHHFGHDKIRLPDYEDRPFHSVDEMDAAMIEYWNRVVEPDDYVIHLGDFSLTDPDTTIGIVRSLKGRIILINGNHDHRTRTFWEKRAGILKWFKRPQKVNNVWLTHAVDWGGAPLFALHEQRVKSFKIWVGKKDWLPVEIDDIVLHGHTHGKVRQIGNIINCGVDAWNFVPIPLPSILPPPNVKEIQNWIYCEIEDYPR